VLLHHITILVPSRVHSNVMIISLSTSIFMHRLLYLSGASSFLSTAMFGHVFCVRYVSSVRAHLLVMHGLLSLVASLCIQFFVVLRTSLNTTACLCIPLCAYRISSLMLANKTLTYMYV
jgi:hypothetical protein